MLISRILMVIAILSLAACASSPRYVPADDSDDYGHYSRKISENRYRVNFNGNRRTNVQETRDFALLRAAELTLAKDFEWFQIVDRETATVTSSEPQAGFSFDRAWYVQRDCGVLGCSRSVRPATYTTYRIDSARPVETHSHSIEILMGKGETPEDGNYYDAKAVVNSIYESM